MFFIINCSVSQDVFGSLLINVLARIIHESLAATTDKAVLPGVLGCRPLRRTVLVRLGFDFRFWILDLGFWVQLMISNLQFRFRDLFFDSHELFSRFSFRNPPSAIRIRRRWLQWQPNWHVATWTRIQKRSQYRTWVFGRGKDRQDQYYGLLIILKGRNSAVARLYHMLCWSCQYENDPRSLPKNICLVAQ